MKSKKLRSSCGKNRIIEPLLMVLAVIVLGSFFILHFTKANSVGLYISEIMFEPSGSNTGKSDWVEICNSGEEAMEIKKDDWGIVDEKDLEYDAEGGLDNTCHKISEDLELKKEECFIIADNSDDFLEEHKEYEGEVVDSVVNLVSDKVDGLWISSDKCANFVDNIDYDGKNSSKEGFTWEFTGDKWISSGFLGGTPGKKYEFVEVIENNSLRLSEILPSPDGGSENEFVEVYNFSDSKIDLSGWQIQDKTGSFVLSGEVSPGEYATFYDTVSLNDSGDDLILVNPFGKEVDKISYEKTRENQTYALGEDGVWKWTKILTPEEKNEFSAGLKVRIDMDENIMEGIETNFEVFVEDADDFKVVWNFGDGGKSYKQAVKHKFEKSGAYEVSVKVSADDEEYLENFTVNAEEFPRPEVKIVRIMPNPEGEDSGSEWLEIENKTKSDIDLKGWGVAGGTSNEKITKHLIQDETIVESGKIKRITGDDCNFSLNNKKYVIELVYPNGDVADKVKYEKEAGVKEGEYLEKNKKGKWVWVNENAEEDEDLEEKENSSKSEKTKKKGSIINTLEQSKKEVGGDDEGDEEMKVDEKDGEISLNTKLVGTETKAYETSLDQYFKNDAKNAPRKILGSQNTKKIDRAIKNKLELFLERINGKINQFLFR